MSKSVIHAVFFHNSDAANAIAALTASGLSPKRFSVIGKDCDSFRLATATLNSTKVDKLVLMLGIAGGLIGTATGAFGVQFMPGFDGTYIPLVTLSATFSGLAVGMVCGVASGAILKLDSIPPSEAEVRLGTVNDGDIVVSVATDGSAERDNTLTVLREHGAKHISYDLVGEVSPSEKQAPALSRIA